MSTRYLNITLPAALRDQIATAAVLQHTTQDMLADTLLRQQLAIASAAHARGAPIAALKHPRLAEPAARASLNIQRATNDQVVALTAAINTTAASPITKSLLIRALLWEAVAPAPAHADPVPAPTPPPDISVTVRVPTSLHTAMRLRAKAKALRTKDMIAALLDRSFADLAADPAIISATLTAWPIEVNRPSTATVLVPHAYHAPIQALADQSFGGIKVRAIQALLGYALAQLDAVVDARPDQPLVISGTLYAQVAAITHAAPQRRGVPAPIRAFVEHAVAVAVARAEAGPALQTHAVGERTGLFSWSPPARHDRE